MSEKNGLQAATRSGVGSFLVGACLLGLLFTGCGGGNSAATSSPGSTDGEFLTCDTETRAMPYAAGMHVASAGGTFAVKLLDSVPGPPVKGNNSWTIEIDDATSGAPVDGLQISVTPWMPDHGHGTQPVIVSGVGGPGQYGLMPVYLYMSGFWQVQIGIRSTGGAVATQDQAIVPICIP